MGVIKQGILGGFSGKVANVIGTSWKGIAVIKSQPLSVSNPRTAAQVGQRTKLAAAVAVIIQILAEVIKPLMDRFAGQMSGYNFCLQASIEAFDSNGAMTHPENFKISRSSNTAQSIDSASVGAAVGDLSISWTPISGQGYALATDKCYAVGIEKETLKVAYSTDATRDDGSAVVSFGAGELTQGDYVEVYLSFLRADGTVGFAQDYMEIVVGA